MRVALVGAGRVGTAVAYLLQQKHHEIVAVSSRSTDVALRAAERLNSDVCRVDELPVADLVLLGVPDGAIEAVAEAVSERVRDGAFVCHFAGSYGPALLKSVVERGATGCATHPVQACPSVDAAIARLPNSAWGVTCTDPGAQDRIMELIDRDLDGLPIAVPEEVRSIWHAASVTTSNGIAALMAAAESMLADIGIDDPVRVLGPLAAGTVQNAREGGGAGPTLTGPVVRGEKEAIRRHLHALMDMHGSHFDEYRTVAYLIVQAALGAGRINDDTATEIMREFGP